MIMSKEPISTKEKKKHPISTVSFSKLANFYQKKKVILVKKILEEQFGHDIHIYIH